MINYGATDLFVGVGLIVLNEYKSFCKQRAGPTLV